MTVESDILDADMRGKLDAAAANGCSPEGHKNIVQFLIMSHTLQADTRNDVRALPEQIGATVAKALKDSQPAMMEIERGGVKFRINGKEAVSKAIKYGTALIFAIYVLARVHGWGGLSVFNLGTTPVPVVEPMKTAANGGSGAAGGTP
jgi:hypothetical protein